MSNFLVIPYFLVDWKMLNYTNYPFIISPCLMVD